MVVLDPAGAAEIGDRPGDAEGAVEPPGAETETIDGGHERAAGRLRHLAVSGEVGGGQATVLGALAAALDVSGGQHPRPDPRGRLGVGDAGELLGGEPLRLDVQVDAVQQWPGEAAGVAVQVVQAAAAGEPAVPRCPQGQGLAAKTSAKRAGNNTLVMARATVTSPSSSGWRNTSQAARENSGSSSRNSTPWLARVQECS